MKQATEAEPLDSVREGGPGPRGERGAAVPPPCPNRGDELWYRALFEAANDGIFILGSAGCIDCNATAARMYGREKQELIGHSPADFSAAEQPGGLNSASAYAMRIGAALGGEPQRFEWVARKPDGTDFDVEVMLTRIREQESPVLIAAVRDITARKRAEEALRRSESKYRRLFENMRQGVFYQAADGSLVDINPAALAMFGLTRDEFFGRTSFNTAWDVLDENEDKVAAGRHPSMIALTTGKPVKDMVMAVFKRAPRRICLAGGQCHPRIRNG